MEHLPDLLATCWTSAGDVVPGRNGDVSPLTVEERVVAVAKAGYRGFGIAAPDLAVVRDTIGYPALDSCSTRTGFVTSRWNTCRTGGRGEAGAAPLMRCGRCCSRRRPSSARTR